MKNFRLYLILDKRLCGERDPVNIADQAIKGGVDIVQLRDKGSSVKEITELAQEIRKLTKEKNIPFIVNDRTDIALAVEADGVHLGDDDLSLELARKVLGKDKIIGTTVRNVREAKDSQVNGADYVSVGAIFPTQTKPDAPVVGIDLIREIASSVQVPFVAIGGINIDNVENVIKAGAKRIAVGKAILGREDIVGAARKLKSKMKEAIGKV